MSKSNCFLIVLLTVTNFCFSQDSTITKLSFDIRLRYDSAKVEFNNFEKKHGGFVKTKNVRMHYLEWGNPKNTPLVWVHGSFTNSYELLSVAESLVKEGYYLIAIDYYGHGLTKIPKNEVSLYHVADDIKELMEVKQIKKAIIGGWSRGGIIATAFYDAYPDKVLGLILEDGGSVSTNTHYHKLSPNELDSRVKDIFKDRVAYKMFDSEYEAYKTFYDYNSGGTQFELLAWLTMDDNKKWSIGIGVEKLFNMSNENEFLDNILRPTKANLFGESMSMIEPKIIYRNLKVPMLILDPTSDQDIFPYERENKQLKNQHPNLITHKIYENTGHNIHNEKPTMFVKDLGTFLKTVKHQLPK
ncbi:MAG: alpha/beta hydrolase [Cytophagales bacterium]|nr:MAG: alpha/beta hydrolase [Cytophagales bacterium]